MFEQIFEPVQNLFSDLLQLKRNSNGSYYGENLNEI